MASAAQRAIGRLPLLVFLCALCAPLAILPSAVAVAQSSGKGGNDDKDDKGGKDGKGDKDGNGGNGGNGDRAGDADNGQSGDADGATKTDDGGKKSSGRKPKADAGDDVEVDDLRQEYLRLRDKLFRSRARAAAVASALYSTRLRIDLEYGSGRYYSVTRATVRLDGANVYDDTSGAVAKDKAPRFQGFVAPGRHQINVRVEATGKDDERFASIVDNTFTVQAPAGRDVVVKVKVKDGGDIPFVWKKRQRGSYQLSLVASVITAKRVGSDASKAKKPDKAKEPAKKPAKSSKRPARSGDGSKQKLASGETHARSK